MSLRIKNTIGGFHNRVDRRLEGMSPRRDMMGRWIYPQMGVEMTEVVLEEVDMYVLCLQNTIAQYIVTRTILELCLVVERLLGARVNLRWWNQAILRLGQADGRAAEGTGYLEVEGERKDDRYMVVGGEAG